MSQEIKTILIAVSATLAALLVHYLSEQVQASTRPVVPLKLPEVADAIPQPGSLEARLLTSGLRMG